MMDEAELDISGLTKAELDEFQRVNAEAILGLEKEINYLRRGLQQFGPGVIPEQNLQVIVRPDGSSNIEDVKKRLKMEIEDSANRLRETIKLTGVTIDNIAREVVDLDDNQCTKLFHLELIVLDRKVIVTYKLQEALSSDSSDVQGNKLLWFEVKFGQDIHNAIGGEIRKSAENLSIHSTFSLLKTYIECDKIQALVLEKQMKSYPNNVSTFVNERGNTCLKISNPKPKRATFTLEWGRKVLNDRVEPDIKVHFEAPQEMLALDSKHVLESSPKMFTCLVDALGLEQAIESLIELVATDGQGSQTAEAAQHTT
ncbi:unnamed protein product [Lymnaea stagnalis]|uniref:Uncharacterized protein n=1 Tax=Lymnaea stagnalis TaxID=6523 RepID=A0AAV2I0X4_LYMST